MNYVVGLMLAVLSTLTYAQKTPLACQVDEAAGLRWEGGKWVVSRFNLGKFILLREGDTFTAASVDKAFEVPAGGSKCINQGFGDILCFNSVGSNLYFSIKSNQGALSRLYGATDNSPNARDTVTVHAFTCTPF